MLDAAGAGEGAQLRQHWLDPVAGAARMLVALGQPDHAPGEHRADHVQPGQLVRASGVVGVGLDALGFEHLAQGYAAALVLDQQHVRLAARGQRLGAAEHRLDQRGVLVVAVGRVHLLADAPDQFGHPDLVLPAVQQDHVVALLMEEDAPDRAGRAVRVAALLVVGLLGERRVEAHHDELELRQRRLRGPQAEVAALHDAAFLWVDQLAVQFLPTQRRALVLLKLFEEAVRQVAPVVEG